MSEASELLLGISNRQQNAQRIAVTATDDDPEKAARAMQLEKVTGTPAPVIDLDLDNFEKQQKQISTAEILKDNQALTDYVGSHPMAAKVSNDDYHNLDTLAKSTKKIGMKSILGAAVEGYKEGVGPGMVGSWMFSHTSAEDFAKIVDNPIARLGWSALSVVQAPLEVPMRVIAGGVVGFSKAMGEFSKQQGLEFQVAGRNVSGEEAFNTLGQAVLDPAMYMSIGLPIANPLGMFGGKANAQLRGMIDATRPYIEAGVEPPVGIHPIIDKLKIEQSKADLKNLDEALRDVQGTNTKQRSQELIHSFIRQQVGEQKIGISAEKVLEIYGDKEPKPDDNKLGWVPNIAEQLETARAVGGDIEIPLADWLAKVDPTLAKELHDDIRVRQGGVTANEAELISKQHEEQQQRAVKEDEARRAELADKLADELYALPPERTPLRDALEDVQGFSYNPERIESAIKYGLANGRHDIVQRALNIARSFVKSASESKPGVSEDSPRYQRIKEDLSRRAKEIQAELSRFEQMAADGGMSAEQIKPLAMVEAYHGSPHTFDAFKDEAIGTGEGAQSYGHGHYIAESRGVAESYKTAGVRPSAGDVEAWSVAHDYFDRYKDVAKAKEALLNTAEMTTLERAKLYQRAAQLVESTQFRGNFYRVRIHAEKEHFLDWDKAFKDQHPHVIEGLKRAGVEINKDSKLVEEYDNLLQKVDSETGVLNIQIIKTRHHEGDPKFQSDNVKRLLELERYFDKGGHYYGNRPESTGEYLYGQVHDNRRTASRMLKEAGIPGIKYLDQGSRKVGAGAQIDDLIAPLMDRFGGNAAKVIAELEGRIAGTKELDPIYQNKQGLTRIQEAINLLKSGEWTDPRTYNYVIFDPSLIEIVDRNGEAINAVRKEAGLEPLIQRVWTDQQLEGAAEALEGRVEEHGPGLKAVVPEGELLPHEQKALEAANEVLERILPNVTKVPSRLLTMHEKGIQGAFQQYSDRIPTILYLLDPAKAVRTVRHEAIHFLRQEGFFTKEEWDTLKYAALDEGWIKHYDIAERYEGASVSRMIEEAVAERFAHYLEKPEVETAAGKVLGKLKDFIIMIKDAIKEVLPFNASVDDIFKKIESGEIARREGTKPLDKRAYQAAQEFEAAGGEPAQKELFLKANAIGMTVDQFKRYSKLIEKQRAEDAAAQEKRALAYEKKTQTKEWKENKARITEEVKTDLEQRPDIAAANFFIEGRTQYANLSLRPKLNEAALTPEQKASLPRTLYGKAGLDPDHVATMFGYQTGAAMVERLGAINAARGEMPWGDYVKQLVKEEVDRRMAKEYGDLNENILAEAKEHVLGQTQMDLLHEETLALGVKSGAIGEGMPYSKDQVLQWVRDRFATTTVGQVSSDKYLRDAGKADKQTQMALLKGDFTEAFKYQQAKYLSTLLAREAKKFEKEMDRFEKRAKRFAKREVEGVSTEYTNYIQDILLKLGQPLKRSVQDLGEAIEKEGYSSFDAFVTSKEAGLRDLNVPDFLRQDGWKKDLKNLTTEEFDQVSRAIKSMEFNGRDERKVEVAGEKADLADVMKKMKEKLETLGVRDNPIDKRKGGAIDKLKYYWWSSINVESMFNRIDRDNPRGIFYQTFVRPFTDASNYKDRLIREYQAKMAALGKIEDMDKLVENNIFIDPLNGEPFIMRKRNVLGILQNVGNINNLTKLAKGYGLEPHAVMDWLHRNTTKEDWDRAQKIGDIFNEIFDMADTMAHNVSGVGLQRLPLTPIQTPHGEYAGWYNPIKYDSLRPGKSTKLMGPNVTEQEGFYRATTPQGYTKQRTGYIAPVELNLDIVPMRMSQMLHDIAVRPAVLQMSKFFYSPEFKRMMVNHYGKHQAEAMIPFLRDFANAANFMSETAQAGSTALEILRQNTIATLIGFNPGTVMKHGSTALVNSLSEVGIKDWTRELITLLKANEHTSDSNWSMAFEKSEELQRRMRNWTEVIQGHGSEINLRGARSPMQSYREFMTHAGATPVSISDLLSAVPTWLAKYKQEIAAGSDEGQAISLANRAVRRAHGSSVLTNKPEIMRTNAIGAWFSSLYGFFSHMQQKQYELAWKAADTYKDVFGKGSGDTNRSWSRMDLVRGLFSYILLPALIEELVTPYEGGEKDTYGRKIAKTLAFGMGSSFVGIRDFIRATINVRDPQAGLIGTSLKAGTDLIHDLSKGQQAFTKQKAGNLIKHSFTLTGVLTGLTNEQEGKIAEYLYRYHTGQERPKGPWDVATGLRYGKTEKHSHTFEEYKRHMLGH